MRWHNHMYAHRPLITVHHGKLVGSNHDVPESMPPTSSINQGGGSSNKHCTRGDGWNIGSRPAAEPVLSTPATGRRSSKGRLEGGLLACASYRRSNMRLRVNVSHKSAQRGRHAPAQSHVCTQAVDHCTSWKACRLKPRRPAKHAAHFLHKPWWGVKCQTLYKGPWLGHWKPPCC